MSCNTGMLKQIINIWKIMIKTLSTTPLNAIPLSATPLNHHISCI